MQDSVASRTALVTSLMRALHTRADPAPIIDDSWGDRLVPEAAIAEMRERALSGMSADARAAALDMPEMIVDNWLRGSASYATVITRSRFTEDALREAVALGIQQYVLIGAGFDSFALRTPPEAQHLSIFEIDHPATQSLKKEQLAQFAPSPQSSVQFLAADLAREDLGSVLSRSSFRSEDPTFFSWLGVTMYLPREANLASLRAIARCAAPGSELVFTYLDQEAFLTDSASGSGSFAELRRRVAAVGEPFLSGFDPKGLAQDLQSIGFKLLEDLDDSQVVERYDRLGVNKLRPLLQSRIARSRFSALSAVATPNPSIERTF